MVVSIAEIVAAKLSGKRTASGFVCCCPAHEDTDLSLSIMEADDGGSRRLHAPSMHERETRQGNPVMQFVPTRDPISRTRERHRRRRQDRNCDFLEQPVRLGSIASERLYETHLRA